MLGVRNAENDGFGIGVSMTIVCVTCVIGFLTAALGITEMWLLSHPVELIQPRTILFVSRGQQFIYTFIPGQERVLREHVQGQMASGLLTQQEADVLLERIKP